MKQLRDQELWDRVKALEGKTIYTIELRMPNTVKKITANEIKLLKSNGKSRKATPTREDIINTYRYLVLNQQVTVGDFGKIPGYHSYRYIISIVLAILRDAVPEQIEAFHHSVEEPHCGIRLNSIVRLQKDWDQLLLNLIT